METENINQTVTGNGPAESIAFSPLTPTLGAEVSGLDVASGISESAIPVLKKALLDYQILLFRQQFLNEEQQYRFANIFGPCREMWQSDHYPSGNKYIHYLSNVDRKGAPVGVHPDRNSTYWHSDGTHKPIPAKATVLNAVEVPEGRGITHFASMYQLFDGLDQATKGNWTDYEAEHHFEFRRAARNKRMPWQWLQAKKEGTSILSQLRWWVTEIRKRWKKGPVYHPIVRLHPETGRLTLFIGDHAWRIKGKFWPTGIRLMKEINTLEIDPGIIYSHQWKPGDLLIWDNSSLLHRLDEYDLVNDVRIMRRCVILQE